MHKINLFKNKKGNTIVSLLIAAGMMVTIIWAVMDLLNLGQKNQTSFVSSMSFQQMRLTSMMTLMNPKLCESVFTTGNHILNLTDPKNAIPTFNAIIMNGQQIVPEVNSKELKDVSLKIEDPKEGPTLPDGKKIYFADFSLTAKQNKTQGNELTFQEDFPIQLIVDSAMKITGCYSNELECPDIAATPSACATSTTPAITYEFPTTNPHVMPNTSSQILKIAADNCTAPASASALIKIRHESESTDRTLGTVTPPTSIIGAKANFDFTLLQSELQVGNNTITVEVTCATGANISCKETVIERLECPPPGGRGGVETMIRAGKFSTFMDCVECTKDHDPGIDKCEDACWGFGADGWGEPAYWGPPSPANLFCIPP